MRYVKDNMIYDIYQIRQEFPNISIPDYCNLEYLGYFNLIEKPIQEFREGYHSEEDIPNDNVQQWKLVKDI